MKRKELIIINILLGSLILFFGLLTIRLSINQDFSSLLADLFQSNIAKEKVGAGEAGKCNDKQPVLLSDAEDDPQLVALKQYQELCHSFVTDRLMIFTSFPQNETAAETDVKSIAKKLISLHQANVSPIVIVEPYNAAGAVSYKEYLAGKFDIVFQVYFQKLREAGVTDDVMGMWVPFPESNTPLWNNKDTEPRDFALCVNKYLGALKAQFPGAKGSVLLSATTYSPNDLEYNNGDYLDLTPYLQDIDKNLVSSIGIQGFPWVSSASTKRREIFNARDFLQPELTIAAARELHTRDIWFNTGSFAAKYTQSPEKKVTLSGNERKAILASILEVAMEVRSYQQNEYRVSLNLFSEDKSETPEATDWSYFQSINSKAILKEFLTNVSDQEIPLSLYDKKLPKEK
jgi:hypothetical protein